MRIQGKAGEKAQMPIAGGILVAESATTRYVPSVTGMLRFIDRLSGKRRHVRRSSGPGAGARAVEETQQGGETNDRGANQVEGIGFEEISSPVAKSKSCCDDSGITEHRYRSPPPPPHLRHLLHRHSHRQSRQRYHHRRDISDEDNIDNDDDKDGEDGNNDDDENDDDADADGNGNDRETSLDQCFHPRLHQRLYDQRPFGSSNVNARLDVEVHRTETTTTVHPIVRNSPTATTTTTTTTTTPTTTTTSTIANPSVVTAMARRCKFHFTTILFLSYTLIGIAEGCSSRSTPKPRPPTPTDRPNITFHMYTCPPDYAEWYCLNGATCFTVKIVDSLLYNCLCANGYIGQRCEFKDLDGSYLPSRQRVMLETASIAGGATIAVLLVIICIVAYIHCKRKQKELRSSDSIDTVDGPGRDPELRPFSSYSHSLMIFTTRNPNNSATIEQTRMPGWNSSEAESMRMASISESKHQSQ